MDTYIIWYSKLRNVILEHHVLGNYFTLLWLYLAVLLKWKVG
jgi:hypothetical protein